MTVASDWPRLFLHPSRCFCLALYYTEKGSLVNELIKVHVYHRAGKIYSLHFKTGTTTKGSDTIVKIVYELTKFQNHFDFQLIFVICKFQK